MKTIVFTSLPDFSDNAFAIFFHMFKEKKEKYKYVWIINEKNKEFESKMFFYFGENIEGKSVKFVYKKSIRGIYYSIFSNYIFFTHGFLDFLPHKLFFWQKRYNLWHGMPLKKIGKMIDKKYPKADKTIATSTIFVEIISKCFNTNTNNVAKLGQPRFDFLFLETESIKAIFSLPEKTEIFLWMPTFRKRKNEATKEDFINQEIAGIKIDELNFLNEKIKKINRTLIIKLHPLDFLNYADLKGYSNIRIIKASEFQKKGIEVNQLISIADVLITDYSSVYFDYLLLKRPIIIYETDANDYQLSRGFTDYKIFKIMKNYNYTSTKAEFLEMIQNKEYKLNIISDSDYKFFNEFVKCGENKFAKQFLDYINL